MFVCKHGVQSVLLVFVGSIFELNFAVAKRNKKEIYK